VSGEQEIGAPEPSADYRSMLWLGAGIIVFTFLVLSAWSAVARIDSAVVASATISMESNRKTVQHLEGGIVREILVRDGDVVREGDVIVRLDPTRNTATDRALRQQLAVALALEARLLAQRDMRDDVAFPDTVTQAATDPLIAVAVNDNRRQFESRRGLLTQSMEVLNKQIAQAEKEVAQSRSDEKTADDQLQSIGQELPSLRLLLERGLVALPRVLALERQEMQTRGALETARINQDKAQEKIAELNARIAQLNHEYRQEGANALPELRKTLSDLRQQLEVSGDALQRIEIKSPVSGTVQQLRIFTIGGVIKAGDPILDLVPASDTLVVRAKVGSIDIDRVHPQMPVEIRIPQFVQFQVQPFEGRVRTVSRDNLFDDLSKSNYFAVEIGVERSSIPAEIDGKLTAGMAAEVLIRNEPRTVLQYLLSPLALRLATALRER